MKISAKDLWTFAKAEPLEAAAAALKGFAVGIVVFSAVLNIRTYFGK